MLHTRLPVMLAFIVAVCTPTVLVAQRQPTPLLQATLARTRTADTVLSRVERAARAADAAHTRNVRHGAVYGAVIGGIASGVLASMMLDHMGCNVSQPGGSCNVGRNQARFTLGSIGLGAVVGAGVGTLVGLAWPLPDDEVVIRR